jgi:hypothetical protein
MAFLEIRLLRATVEHIDMKGPRSGRNVWK